MKKKKASTWKPPEGSLQLKDVEVGKIVYLMGTSSRLMIASDQANWDQDILKPPIQKAWAWGVLVQNLDSSGNPYSDSDKRSTPFVTVRHWLSATATIPAA